MRAAAIISGLILSLAASAALACPQAERCDHSGYEASDYDDRGYDDRDYEEDRYGPPQDAYDAPAVWEDERGLYMHGIRGADCDCAPPPCACGGELTLASSFFYDTGGVGPIPDGGYYGGGGYYIASGGGSSSHAFASASARASANVSVRYRGGGRHGGGHPHGHGGHKGGKGH